MPARSMLLVCLLLAAAGAPRAQELSRAGRFPQTPDNIHLEMVFNDLLPKSGLGAEAGVVDLVWGSSWATLPPGMYNSAYIPYSVDNFTNDVAWYKAHHPDWLEYKCDRKSLAFEFADTAHAPLDIASPQVRAYQWSNWVDAPLAVGYQGLAVDTMSLGNAWQRCGHFDAGGTWVQQYAGAYRDAAFVRDVLAWERATYAYVHGRSATATMQVNVSYDFGATLADNQRLMTATDLVFDERGFTNWGTIPNVPTPAEWTTIVAQIEAIQSKGVCYTTNGEEPQQTKDITVQERLWVIANYLLVKGGCTYMAMSGTTATGAQDYGRLISFPEFRIAIGHPLAAMAKAQGVWQRRFSAGLALVNPYEATATVRLPPGAWFDVHGKPVGATVTLARQTADVLLTKP